MKPNTIGATPTAQASASVCLAPLARHIQFGFGLENVWKEKEGQPYLSLNLKTGIFTF